MTKEEASRIRSAFCNGYEYPFGGSFVEMGVIDMAKTKCVCMCCGEEFTEQDLTELKEMGEQYSVNRKPKMWAKSEGAYVLSARKFNSEMERHPEWFERKSTSSGFMIYWGLKLKEVL